MSTFAPAQGDGVPAAAPTSTTISCQMPEKPPPVPWQQLTSTFETTSEAKPASAPLIGANTTLEQDKATVLMCWLAMGGKEDVLRRRYYNEDYDEDEDTDQDEEEYLMRDEPSDNVSEWWRVTVEGGRVTWLEWNYQGLRGTIPAEIGALSALTVLDLSDNELNGTIPPTIGALSSITHLYLNNNKLNGAIPPTIGALPSLTDLHLSDNSLSGIVPYSLSNLLNLETLSLGDNNLSNNPGNLEREREIQYFFHSFFRHPTIRLVNYGIAITKKRQDSLSTTTTSTGAPPAPPPHPFFDFLATHEHTLTDLILSFLDPLYCCNKDRTALLKCWKSLVGAEDKLRRGYGDDVARWKGVREVKDGRVVEVFWYNKGLKGNLPSEIGELDGLLLLDLHYNEISSTPSEIGKLTSLTKLDLSENHLADLPRELGNLSFLTYLNLMFNRLSVLPSTLANLTNLSTITLSNNNFTIDVPSSNISFNKEQVQTFLATLKSMSESQN